MGHWPRRSATHAQPTTVYKVQLAKIIQHLAGVWAPNKPVTSIIVEQHKDKATEGVRMPVFAITIKPSFIKFGAYDGEKWHILLRQPIPETSRKLLITAGMQSDSIPAHARIMLQRSGFSLRNVP